MTSNLIRTDDEFEGEKVIGVREVHLTRLRQTQLINI